VSVLVVGIGHPDRGDDGIGPRVSERVRELLPPEVDVVSVRGDLFALLERWRDADTVLVVDAMRSGAEPGTVRRIDVDDGGIRGELASFASTHSIDLKEAIELARSLHRLPRRLILYGVEAACFELGEGLSPPVERAIEGVIARILEECPCTRHR
jgi:hydrogenase maturation protease